jgi:hypothetical protein
MFPTKDGGLNLGKWNWEASAVVATIDCSNRAYSGRKARKSRQRRPKSAALQFLSYRLIQGPVSSSKCLSNRHIKAAAAAQIIGNIKNHTMITSCASRKQSRQAVHDRLTALPGVRPDLGAMSGKGTLSRFSKTAIKLAH